MSDKKMELARQRVRRFDAECRSDRISYAKRDMRRLMVFAKLDEAVPMEEALRSLSVPPDYEKVIDYLGTCPPKMLRLANHCLDIWSRMDSVSYMGILKSSFFDESGRLKPGDIGQHFREFHEALLEKRREMKREERKWVPWDKVEKKLFRE
jgi:hypothetical protein